SSSSALSRGQKVAFLLLSVLMPWLGTRLRDWAQALDLTAESSTAAAATDAGHVTGSRGVLLRRAQSVARWYLQSAAPRVGSVHAVCAALNFIVFLRRGVFADLGERSLGIRMAHIDPTARRQARCRC
ncbi:unnamed protein product, partial [Polarella glacialis]